MPVFIVSVPEIYLQNYRVEAETAEEAARIAAEEGDLAVSAKKADTAKSAIRIES